MKKQLLTILAIGGALTGFAQTILLSESFTGQTQPAGWTNDSLGQPNLWQWVFNNPNARTITGAGFDTDFAMLDSDYDGGGASQLASLTTPAFATTGFTTVRLKFDEQFRSYSGSVSDLDYSIDGGVNWTSIRSTTANVGYPTAVTSTFTLPANAANVADLRIKFTYTGTWAWWWAIDNVMVLGLNDCSGTPVAGTITGCPSSVCPNVPYDMMLNGASGDLGITYQWMSSMDSINFSNLVGDTMASFHDSTSNVIYYQVVVTCTSSGMSDTTAVVAVDSINPPTMCYCLALHPDCSLSDFISHVSINSTTLNNNDSTCSTVPNQGAYSIYPASGNTTATLQQGATYQMNVTTQDNHIVSVWIDYDHSGTFDPSEWTQICTTSTPNVTNTASIMIPINAAVGITGMRVRARSSGNTNDANSACINMGSGECEDYFVTIQAAPMCAGAPNVGTIINCPHTICPNTPYTMSLDSADVASGLQFQWFSSTDNVNFSPISGANSTIYTDSITMAPIYYQAVVTCTASGMTDTTVIVSVDSISPIAQCYCVPTQPNCSVGDLITDVSIDNTTLNNNDSTCNTVGGGVGAYSVYPASGSTTATLEQGAAYNINVITQDDHILSVWIDFDQSGTFDPSEWTQICTTSTVNVANTASISVPANATIGLTGMRVRARLSGNQNDASSACIYMGSGECEDYFVTITAPTGLKTNVAPQFAMYPNPAQNAVTLKLTNGQIGSVINVIDVLGNKVIAGVAANQTVVNLDTQSLVNGVYFVSIENEAGNTVKRLVISK